MNFESIYGQIAQLNIFLVKTAHPDKTDLVKIHGQLPQPKELSRANNTGLVDELGSYIRPIGSTLRVVSYKKRESTRWTW